MIGDLARGQAAVGAVAAVARQRCMASSALVRGTAQGRLVEVELRDMDGAEEVMNSVAAVQVVPIAAHSKSSIGFPGKTITTM